MAVVINNVSLLSLCSCSCVVWVTSTSTTGDNTLFTRTATAPTILLYSGSGRYVCVCCCVDYRHRLQHLCSDNFDNKCWFRSSLPPTCHEGAGLAFEDQSLFGRTGLFALMKEPKVVPALVIICLDSSFKTHTHTHTHTRTHTVTHAATIRQQTTHTSHNLSVCTCVVMSSD